MKKSQKLLHLYLLRTFSCGERNKNEISSEPGEGGGVISLDAHSFSNRVSLQNEIRDLSR